MFCFVIFQNSNVELLLGLVLVVNLIHVWIGLNPFELWWIWLFFLFQVSISIAMDEFEFRRILELFPIVRPRDYCVNCFFLFFCDNMFLHFGYFNLWILQLSLAWFMWMSKMRFFLSLVQNYGRWLLT